MAKKVVASLQSSSKSFVKVIKTEKSSKTGAYIFKEQIVSAETVKDVLNKK